MGCKSTTKLFTPISSIIPLHYDFYLMVVAPDAVQYDDFYGVAEHLRKQAFTKERFLPNDFYKPGEWFFVIFSSLLTLGVRFKQTV
ncbi:MAG: hypothetical protein EOM83_11040 [Clostridia bacterium]|nr:hypothetical protein [Clostridia bacterium]